MTNPNGPSEATSDQPPVYVPPPADTTTSNVTATDSAVSRETDSDDVARARAALDAAIAKQAANSASDSATDNRGASSAVPQVPEAPPVGVTPVGVGPVVIGPNGLPQAAPTATVENLVADAVRLKDEATQAVSTLVKFSRMPEEAMMRRVETALHALIQKVL